MSKISKKQLKDNAVDSSIVEDESLTGDDVLDGSITNADISATANINITKLDASSIPDGQAIISSGGQWIAGAGSGTTPHAASHTDGTDDIFDSSSSLVLSNLTLGNDYTASGYIFRALDGNNNTKAWIKYRSSSIYGLEGGIDRFSMQYLYSLSGNYTADLGSSNTPVTWYNDIVMSDTLKIAGNTMIGSTVDDGINKLQVTGDIKVDGQIKIADSAGYNIFDNAIIASDSTVSGMYFGAGRLGFIFDGATKMQLYNQLWLTCPMSSTHSVYAKDFHFLLDNDTSITNPIADNMAFNNNAIETMRTTENNNLVIGSTVDDGINKLQVNGSVLTVADDVSDSEITIGIKNSSSQIAGFNYRVNGYMNYTIDGNAVGWMHPIYGWHTKKDMFVTQQTVSYNTDITAPSLCGYNDRSSGIYFPTDSVAIVNNSIETLRTTANNNLLIGATTENVGAEKLQVTGNTMLNGNVIIGSGDGDYTTGGSGGKLDIYRSDGYKALSLTSSSIIFNSNGINDYIKSGTALHRTIRDNSNFVRIDINDADIFKFMYNTTEYARFATGGNFLIGSTVDDGINKLQVTGSANIKALSETIYGLQTVGEAGGAKAIFIAGQAGVSNGFTVDYTGTQMLYKFLNGNMLLGSTVDTGEKLQVNGDIITTSVIANGAISSFSGGKVCMDAPNDSIGRIFHISNNASTQGSLQLLTFNSSGSSNPGIKIEPTGNITINGGIDDGINKLQVNGSIGISNNTGMVRNTIDGLDNGAIGICGGGAIGASRGAYLHLWGNEGTGAGAATLTSGDGGGVVNLAINDATKLQIAASGNVLIGSVVDDGINKLQVNGYTKLGEDATGIKMKVLTGTTASTEGGIISIPHSFGDSGDVISWTCQVEYAPGGWRQPEYTHGTEFQYSCYLNGVNFQVELSATNSGNILSKMVRIVVWYKA